MQDYDKTKLTISESEEEMKILSDSIEVLKVKKEDLTKNISELKENKDVKNPVDEFRVYWYRKYMK